MTVLSVENLQTHFFTDAGVVKAVDDVSFTLNKGEVLGLVGESGSGKTVTGFSILRLVDAPGRVTGGTIRFLGQDLATLPDREMRRLRGNRIAMIFIIGTMLGAWRKKRKLFSWNSTANMVIHNALLDRFLACMKPASITCAGLVPAFFLGFSLRQRVYPLPHIRAAGDSYHGITD